MYLLNLCWNTKLTRGFLGVMIIIIMYLSTQTFAQIVNTRLPLNTFDFIVSSKNFNQNIINLKVALVFVSFAFSSLSSLIFFLYKHILICLDLVAFATNVFIFLLFQSNRRHLHSTSDELNEELFVHLKKIITRQIENKSLKDKISVSVLIAARNEQNTIKACVESLMQQNYSNYEVLVMNDNSTDKTATILNELKFKYKDIPIRDEDVIATGLADSNGNKSDERLKCFSNSSLPFGWYGKSWSIQNLAMKVKSDILIMVDADTQAKPNLIRYCIRGLAKRNVDFLSGIPKQKLDSLGLKIIVYGMFIMPSYIIPLAQIRDTSDPDKSFAIGQLMVVKKIVFDKVGGLEKVRNKICEDLQFVRLLKKSGFKTDFIPLENHITCKMYNSFIEAFFGMAKNVFSALDYSWKKYLYSTLIFGSIIYPFVLIVLITYFNLISISQILLNLMSIIIFTISWIQSMELYQQSKMTAFFYPLMMFTMFSVSLYSTYITFLTKGHTWKGRRVN